jgi:hypothetical protein
MSLVLYTGLLITGSFALIVSLISLWKSILTPFKLKISYDSPTLSIYRISPKTSGGKNVWWLPSIDIDHTFYNLGKRDGEVIDIRFKGILTSEKRERTKFVFYAKWVVDFKKFWQNRDDRLKWIDSAVERVWHPLILAGNEQKNLHIVFEGFRWDKKQIGSLKLSFQVFSSEEKKWIELEEFIHTLEDHMYNDTSAYNVRSKKLSETRGDLAQQWNVVD